MAWYEESVFYHIYPLGMLNAPNENHYDHVKHRLRELDKWIPHIKEIGANAIYIGPLFESVGHGYETTDYMKTDSRLGDNEDLKHFVSMCHQNDIRVIFDGVFNHTGRDFFAFKDIRENRENSAYRDWYCNVNFYGNNEYNDGFSYDNWGGYNLLVKLNQRNGAVIEYLCNVVRYWVSEFDVDGIRLDAADVLDFDFMRTLRNLADSVKPDFWLMGEVIHGDYTRWVNDSTLHSVTNYVLHKALYSGHNDHNYFEIAHTVKRLCDMCGNNFGKLRLYNFVDNHDVERIASKLNNRSNLYPVHILLYTLPGVPSIYYGSEFGIEGKKEHHSDASLRPALSYDNYINSLKDNPLTAFISALSKIRHSSPALSYGDYRELMLTNRQYAFVRNFGNESVVIAVNNDENPVDITLCGLRNGHYRAVLAGRDVTASDDHLSISIPANYGEILLFDSEASGVSDDSISDISNTDKFHIDILPIDRSSAPEVNVTANKNVDVNANPTADSKMKASTGFNTINGTDIDTNIGSNVEINIEANAKTDIASRTDYENMSIEELQAAILSKMAQNGPVNDHMKRTVYENVYPDSLRNWVKSFR